jgi:hypothetical protein
MAPILYLHWTATGYNWIRPGHTYARSWGWSAQVGVLLLLALLPPLVGDAELATRCRLRAECNLVLISLLEEYGGFADRAHP